MKELTIEEKAKRYDEALQRTRKWWDSNTNEGFRGIFEEIFPELKEESKGERIRKRIYKLLWDNAPYEEAQEYITWLEKQGKEKSWKPSKEEMDALYGLAYITNQYDEHKEEVITRLYQDLKREFFNGSSYENMFPNTEDGVRRRSTIQVLEYARSLDNYNQYGKEDIDKDIAWLEKQGNPTEDELEALRMAAYEPTKNWSEKLQSLYEKLTHYEQKPVFEMKTPEESLGIDSNTYNKIVDECVYGEQKPVAKYKVGDTIYYDSFGRLVSFVIANIVEDGTDNPMYEDKDGNSVFQNDIVELKPTDKVEPKDYSSIDPHFFKATDKVEPKFHEGDNIEPIDSCLGSPRTIYKICDGWYETNQGILDFEFENNWRLIEQKPAWSEEDEGYYDAIIAKLEVTQEDALLTDNEMDFLKSLEKRVFPKSNWNEEDITRLKSAITLLQNPLIACDGVNDGVRIKTVDWLKFLEERYTWKPSEEQMIQLKKYCPDNRPLTLLYEQLKKLVNEK